MHSLILAAAVVICATGAVSDLRTRRIPNALSIAIAALGFVRLGYTQDLIGDASTLAAAGAAFAITVALFRWGAIGGGDAKMITAMTVLVGYQQITVFLFLMSLCGGALALVMLAAERLHLGFGGRRTLAHTHTHTPLPRDGGLPGERQRATVPYGVAVAAGGVISLISAG
jgi:prepilin peptidase CpaA